MIERKLAWSTTAYVLRSLGSAVSVNYITHSACMTEISLSNVHGSRLFTYLLFFDFIKVAHYIWNRFFVHGHSLLKYMKSPWYDIKLRYNFFEGLSEFFTTSTDSIICSIRCVVHISSSSPTRSFGWRSILPSSRFISSSSRSFGSWWSFLCDWWNTSNLLVVTLFGTKIFNKFLIIFFKVTFPNHDNWVSSSCSEVVSRWWESSRSRWSLMSIKSVQNVSLPQIPNLNSRIVTARQKISTIWMEIDFIDYITMSIVVLN